MAISTSKANLISLFWYNHFNLFLLHLLLLVGIQELAVSQSTVEFLPGFSGPLPFHLETGYVGVDESEDVQLFYYFVKSERNPREDPLILWLTGGAGCTSFTGLVYEIGPLYFEPVEYNGTLPTLVLNPNTWTKVASIIFLDLPVGTGFSYGRTSLASQSTDRQACAQAHQFVRKWLISHPEFLSNRFYLGGDSYSGITVPIITQMISDGNEADAERPINLKGYLLGNPATFPAQGNYSIPFSHGMGIISDELYESLRKNCALDHEKLDADSNECSRDLEAFDQCISGLNKANILETECGLDSPNLRRSFSSERRTLKEGFDCRVDGYWLSSHWANNKNVQNALHIRKGTIGTWIRCNHTLDYETVIFDTRQYHVNLSRKGYRSLIYSGDHDMVIPFQSTETWIRNLNYSIIDEWRSWIVKGQVAGYTRAYSNQMTFATVKGGGHTAPEYRPKECYAMFERWISHQPL